MLSRSAAVASILAAMDCQDVIVCALGYLSRELYAQTATMRGRCFYCMGSMGSVVPLALGVALARPTVRVLALEGDGSLLMNLGTVATLRRYGSPQIRLIVFDNGHYESTGGQVSQPEGFELQQMCSAAGLQTSVASSSAHIAGFLADPQARALVVKTALGGQPARIMQPPPQIASAFIRELEARAGHSVTASAEGSSGDSQIGG